MPGHRWRKGRRTMLRAASLSTKGARFVAVSRWRWRHAQTSPRRAEDVHIAGTTPAVRRGRPTEPAAELAMHADVDLLDSLVASIAIYPPRGGKGRRADCDRV